MEYCPLFVLFTPSYLEHCLICYDFLAMVSKMLSETTMAAPPPDIDIKECGLGKIPILISNSTVKRLLIFTR